MPLPRAYWRWSAGMQLARLPSTMAPLAFTLLATALTGSYRLGGVLMALFVVAELLGAVPAGRLLDRIGHARGLALLLIFAAITLGALDAVAWAGLPVPVVVALVLLPGAVTGGLSGGFRALLAGIVPDANMPRAVAVDAMANEGVLIAGPLLVSGISLAGALLPLAAMAAACAVAVVLVPRTRATASRQAPAKLPLRSALPWLACQFAIGHLLSTIEVAPLPLVERLGAGSGAAGFVIAVLSGASIAGSALYAWRPPKISAARQAVVLLSGFMIGGTVVTMNLGWPGLLGGTALIGVCTGPLVVTASVQLQRLLPPGRRAEGFSLALVVQGTGFALGSLSIGLLPLEAAPALGVVSSALVCVTMVVLTSRRMRHDGSAAETGDAGDVRLAQPGH